MSRYEMLQLLEEAQADLDTMDVGRVAQALEVLHEAFLEEDE